MSLYHYILIHEFFLHGSCCDPLGLRELISMSMVPYRMSLESGGMVVTIMLGV